MKNVCPLFLVVILLIASHASPVQALESRAVKSPRNIVSLISDVDSVAPGASFHVALHFRLTNGWHIYWSNPGDAGQPPSLHLHLPDGGTASAIEWPAPLRLAEGPAMVFAYTGDVTLPLSVTLASTTPKARRVEADADWLVCAEKCVPEKGHFELSIPTGATVKSPQAPLIEKSLKRLPQAMPFSSHLDGDGSVVLQSAALSAATVADAWFFPEHWGDVVHAAPQTVEYRSDGIELKLTPGALFKATSPLSGILVVKAKGGAESFYAMKAEPAEAIAVNRANWPKLLLFALLGGLILNLMPCVFPVLAMKALSLAKLSGVEREHVRLDALFYTVGVLSAFGAFACVLLGLRAAGHAAGWGFQFQSPLFVISMAWLFLILGLNLSNVFTVGSRFMGFGQDYASKPGRSGSFFTGALAVIVATPCVAPFLGASIAAALTAPALEMIAIFLFMGLGLALPYLLLALWPQAMGLLPRPGAWMETLRQALAFPMYGASAWLLWVVSQELGPEGLASALEGAVVLAFAAWLYGQATVGTNKGRTIRLVAMIVTITVIGLLGQIPGRVPAAGGVSAATGEGQESYSTARLQALRADDRAVFVDMTAAWCITCLVNEQGAIASDSVQAAFKKDNVVYLKGDWTNEDPAITSFLKQHQSEGVPLYVFYPKHQGEEVVLPQILTPSIILNAIDHPAT